VHAAAPLGPVQLWLLPRHATGVAYAQQPLLPSMHVARPPETHAVSPLAQLLVQVSEHAAAGSIPEHDSGLVHVVVDST